MAHGDDVKRVCGHGGMNREHGYSHVNRLCGHGDVNRAHGHGDVNKGMVMVM